MDFARHASEKSGGLTLAANPQPRKGTPAMYPWWTSTEAIADLSHWLRTTRNYSMEDLQTVWADLEGHGHLWTEYLMTLPYVSPTPELLFAE
jgi:hypothetical protein